MSDRYFVGLNSSVFRIPLMLSSNNNIINCNLWVIMGYIILVREFVVIKVLDKITFLPLDLPQLF